LAAGHQPRFGWDTQIAAIAREYGLTVATRNVRHFPFCQVENPFELKDPPVQPGS
jgi:predicted nucleic acid-binding protein